MSFVNCFRFSPSLRLKNKPKLTPYKISTTVICHIKAPLPGFTKYAKKSLIPPHNPPPAGPNNKEHKNTGKNLNEILIAAPILIESIPKITLIAISIERVQISLVVNFKHFFFIIKNPFCKYTAKRYKKNNGFAATECENNTASQKLFVSRTTSRSDLT